ncbi:phospholipase [Candidatus Pacearchaeota archaeon CG10_big_fil_rev_8_21_14_0_10_31_24]|nr:MAG: phospholipase [Candidatus Pacearchaeota archaeon CG10_big_fil_rev_8_21_14_0_10_31_24]
MKNKKSKKNKHIILRVILVIILLWLIVAFYQSFKPLPEGISYEGKIYKINDEDINFLHDLTYLNNSEKVYEQEIFSNFFQIIDNANKFIIIDAFLFNSDYVANPNLIPISTNLKNKLIEKKKSNPEIQIIFITDEINNFYGSYTSKEIQELKDNNITLVITDLTKLRDSNPTYSSIWRTYLQWFGTKGSGSIKHPLGNLDENVTIRSFLKLLNTKANHRKVIVADQGNNAITLITSANPHEASSLHSNIAFLIKKDIWQDVLESELSVARFSGTEIDKIDTSFVNQESSSSNIEVQLLTEGKIRKNLLEDIKSTESGESINLAMFYLSDRDIINELSEADKRGVIIQIILDPNKDAFAREKNGIPNRQVAWELVKNAKNLKLRWFDTHGEQFHTKLLIINKKGKTILYGGSSNYTKRNLKDLNLESIVKISTPLNTSISNEVNSYFNRLWNNKGANYTLDFEAYKEDSISKTILYRLQEASGFSSF